MSANTKDIQTKVATLKSMFPEWAEEELKEALVQYKCDVEDVVDKILGGLITPWEKLEKNSNSNKQTTQNTSHVVGASRPVPTNTTSSSTSTNFRNSTFKTSKAPNTTKFNSNHVGTKPTQSSRNTGSNASLKKPVTSTTQNSISKPTSTGTKKAESALEQLKKYKNFKVLNDEEVDDLTWADKMTYKKKLKEFNILQEQAKEEIEKKRVEDDLKEKEAKLKEKEAPVVEETPEPEPVQEEVKEEEEEVKEEETKEESVPVEEAPVETEQAEEAESAKQTNLLGDYSDMKSAVEGIAPQPQVGTPSSQFQQASQPFMGYNGAPNYSQYNQGFIPQNQMYPNNFADQMAMYNQFMAYNHFQQMQYMQQQQPGTAPSTAPNTATGESPSQQTYDFASGRQMMGMQQPQFMQNTYPGYGYGQYAGQQPQQGQEEQQPQQGSEMPQQDQFAYYQHQMQQPYGQQNYYNNQNYNQY